MGEGDQPYACHACAGTIGAYFFAHDAAGWRQTKRHDALATSGVEGNIGETSIAKLADGHYAMTAEWGSCWQGYCGSWLVIAGLQADTAIVLAPGLPLAADNDGAYGACSALDMPRDADDKTEDNHECLDIRSKWRFQGNRLVVTFEGRLTELGQDGNPGAVKRLHQQAVYELSPGRLRLIKGTNPVPNF